jgi:hypothetical protein
MDAQLEFVKRCHREDGKADFDARWSKNGCQEDNIAGFQL